MNNKIQKWKIMFHFSHYMIYLKKKLIKYRMIFYDVKFILYIITCKIKK